MDTADTTSFPRNSFQRSMPTISTMPAMVMAKVVIRHATKVRISYQRRPGFISKLRNTKNLLLTKANSTAAAQLIAVDTWYSAPICHKILWVIQSTAVVRTPQII